MKQAITANDLLVLEMLSGGFVWDVDNLISEIEAHGYEEVIALTAVSIVSLRKKGYVWGGLEHCQISEKGKSLLTSKLRQS